MNKNVIFIGLLIVTTFIIGMVFLNKKNNKNIDKQKIKTQDSIIKNEITITSTSEANIDITPTKKPTVSNDVIDAKLKEIDADTSNVNNSFSDTAVDVMSE